MPDALPAQGQPRPAEAGLRFVDAHHHLYDLEANYYPWLCDEPPAPWIFGDTSKIRQSYRVEDYLQHLQGFDVAKSVHVQVGWNPGDPVGETAWLQSVADRAGFPQAIVGFAELQAADFEQTLAAHARFANFRGIRQNLNWHADPLRRIADRPDYMSDTAWRRGFARLAPLDLSFDLQIFHPQMHDAYELAKAFPETRIILNHAGMPMDRDENSLALWAAGLKQLAQAPNVAAKISGLGLGQPGWTTDDLRPLVLTVIDAFGPDRCMFGTDLPVDALFCDHRTIFTAFVDICSGFSRPEQEDLFARTAERWYRI